MKARTTINGKQATWESTGNDTGWLRCKGFFEDSGQVFDYGEHIRLPFGLPALGFHFVEESEFGDGILLPLEVIQVEHGPMLFKVRPCEPVDPPE